MGAVREKLKWADGKLVKDVIEKQVVHVWSNCYYQMRNKLLIGSLQVEVVLGPKTEEDLKPSKGR